MPQVGEPGPVRVLVVEDDQAMREHLTQAIAGDAGLELVGAAANVHSAIALLDQTPDVLVADLGLPDGSGLDVIRASQERDTEILAMVVTALGDERSVISAIEAGACGYLLKDESTDAIAESIWQLVRGGSPIHPGIARHVLKRLQSAPVAAAEKSEEAPHLSAREHEILSLVAKGFRFGEIAAMAEISEHTVRTHIRRIYAKLEVASKSEAVYEAVQQGILTLD